jgi:hypothetical protein
MAFAAFQSNAFLNAAFQTIFQQVPQPGDGFAGRGYYRKPTIYLDRDGKPVDIHARKPEPVIEPEILPELTPAMLEALMARMQVPPAPKVDPMASIEAKMGRMLIQRELDAMADDDAALVLLLT